LPSNESFGLTAAQLLGAAAACEQYHSDSVSLDGAKPKNSGSDGQAARADIHAAQQNMLDPAATMPNNLNADDVDCDRMSAAFNQLQWIEGQDQNLGKQLDQPDALPPDSQNKSRSR
jgi:hypothetical protein